MRWTHSQQIDGHALQRMHGRGRTMGTIVVVEQRQLALTHSNSLHGADGTPREKAIKNCWGGGEEAEEVCEFVQGKTIERAWKMEMK